MCLKLNKVKISPSIFKTDTRKHYFGDVTWLGTDVKE